MCVCVCVCVCVLMCVCMCGYVRVCVSLNLLREKDRDICKFRLSNIKIHSKGLYTYHIEGLGAGFQNISRLDNHE